MHSLIVAQSMFKDEIMEPEEYLEKVDQITNEDIMKVARDLFKWNKVRIAVIGNVEKKDIKF